MTKEKLNVYSEALVALYKMIDDSSYKIIKTKAFITEYKVHPDFFKALEILGYISIKKLSRRSFAFKLLKNSHEPVDARKIIDVCTTASKTTVFKMMDIFNEGIQILEESTVRKVFRHKFDHSKILKDLEQAISLGVNLNDYEIHTVVNSPRATFLQKQVGRPFINDSDIEKTMLFLKHLKKLKGNSDFQKQLININAKIGYAQKDPIKLAALRKERVELYIKHKIIPRSNFKDLDLYYSLKK